MPDFSGEFISYLAQEKRYAAHTLEAYRRDLKAVFDFLEEHLDEKVSQELFEKLEESDLHAYMAHTIQHQKRAKSSLNRSLSCIKSFFKWLKVVYGVRNDAILAMRGVKQPKAAPRAVTEVNIWRLLQQVRPDEESGVREHRNWVLVLLLYGLGLRISEAIDLNYGDVDGEVLVVRGKGDKERQLPLPDVIRKALKDLPVNRRKTAPLLAGTKGQRLSVRSAQVLLKGIREKMGLPNHLTPHALRHSFATHLLENGADIRTVQELLGHASLSTTQRYLAVDSQRMIKAHREKHPLEMRKKTSDKL